MHKQNVKCITSLKEIRVINDPYRREILNAMALIDKPVTAKDIADHMEEPPSKVNYHVGVLHKYGFIDLHHTENINGIIAKLYNRSLSKFQICIEGVNAKTKEMAAVRDIVASTFDMSRDKHITALIKSMNEEKEKEDDIDEFLYSKALYLNDEEIKEFSDFMERVSKNKKSGRKLYDVFVAYVELDDRSKK